MQIPDAIEQLLKKVDLSPQQMQALMQQVMTGQCGDAQIAGFLIALRAKGESVDEISSAAQVMRDLSTKVAINDPHLIDIVGTGGDGTSTFNVSTSAAFVAAGAGATVAKHGNRSVSSKSGSADLLESLGAQLELSPSQVSSVVDQAGVGFMFAPMHHSAMRHAITARKEMGVRTLFNVLGPLTNPAQVKRQVVGVYQATLTATLAEVFKQLGSVHSLVVHGEDGMDEISICAPTIVSEWNASKNTLENYTIDPEQFGFKKAPLSDITVDGPQQSMTMLHSVLNGEKSTARDVVLLNAGAAIYVSGREKTLSDGVLAAADSIDSGKANAVLRKFIDATQRQN